MGAKLMIGKGLGILYPFAGIGFQRNEGSITSSMTGALTETLTGGSFPGSANSTIIGSARELQCLGTQICIRDRCGRGDGTPLVIGG